MHSVKKIWKASGKRHATSFGAKEKPSVSQLEIEKPVIPAGHRMPLDKCLETCCNRTERRTVSPTEYTLPSVKYLEKLSQRTYI